MIYNKFDTEKCLKDIEKYIIESKDVKDIFIVMDRNKNIIEKCFNDSQKVLNYITKNKDYKKFKDYKLLTYVDFISDFVKETNKYRSYDKYKVIKYQKTLDLGSKNDVALIKKLEKEPQLQMFLREKKLERIVNGL